MNTFDKDLIIGQKYEKLFINYIDYDKCRISSGLKKEYDIKTYLNGKKIKYEIKADRIAFKTNNIPIEHHCSGIKSGILTTRAHFYGIFIIKDDNEFDLYIIPIDFIKQLIKDNKYFRDIRGGNSYLSQFYLFNLGLFNDYKIII